MWAEPSWFGRHLPADVATRPGGALAAYASWCTTVEGNTTFYALPAPEVVARWREAVVDHPNFRFCFKLPRTITHERRLRSCEDELARFLSVMEPLGPWLGPTMIQLPSSFEPDDLGVLDAFLAGLPQGFASAVEVRNPGFFPGGAWERPLNDLLAGRGVNRVLLDSRPLFSGPCVTPGELDAFENKPRVGVRPVATGSAPLVRFIGLTDPEATVEAWQVWLDKVEAWVRAGLDVYFFVHTPDNVEAPPLNRRFHEAVMARLGDRADLIGDLPEPVRADEQLDLFNPR